MPTPTIWKPEIFVNTEETLDQTQAEVTGLADGRFVAVWTDYSRTAPDTSGGAIRAQIFNADGTKSGGEFLVNEGQTFATQSQPTVDAFDDGGFVITWSDSSGSAGSGPDLDSYGIKARIYGANGQPAAPEFQVNTDYTGPQESSYVATLADGGFVVVWEDATTAYGDPTPDSVTMRIFDADGTERAAPARANTSTDGTTSSTHVAALEDGRFVVTYQVFGSTLDTDSGGILATVYNADGTVSVPEFLVNDDQTPGNQTKPKVTGLEDGGFAVTWTDTSGALDGESGEAIAVRVFDASGSATTATLVANSTGTTSQEDSDIQALKDGRFLVTWEDDSDTLGDESGSAIHGQVFNADGTLDGVNFLINTTTTTVGQYDPEIGLLEDGRIIVTFWDYSSTGGDLASQDVRAQIIDPRTGATQLNGTTLNDQFMGTGFGDTLNGFLGNDTIQGRAGDDVVNGDAGNDTLRGNWGNDILNGGYGNDILFGDHNADRLFGGAGSDRLYGGTGIDYLEGGSGDDFYYVDRKADVIVENGGGTDAVVSGSFALNLNNYDGLERVILLGEANIGAVGDTGYNRLDGNAGNNNMFGGSGNDRIIGNDGNDTLRGDAGKDTLTGGADDDTFLFIKFSDSTVNSSGRDSITDFTVGEDVIDLSVLDAQSGAGNQAFDFIGAAAFSGTKGELRFFAAGSNTMIQGDRDGDGSADFAISLTGTIGLNASDFIL